MNVRSVLYKNEQGEMLIDFTCFGLTQEESDAANKRQAFKPKRIRYSKRNRKD